MIENGQLDGGYVLNCDGKRIPFRIEYRKRKKLAISVHPDPRLEIVAPEGTPRDKVLRSVEKRASWILRQWRYFEQFLPKYPGHRFVAGETHVYLGKQYRLKLHEDGSETVKLVGRFLHVHTGDRTNREQIELLLNRWYRDRAVHIFEHRLETCLERCPALKLAHQPRLLIRKMTHRWGSCTKSGTVLINLELIKVPIHCVDYVLVHELCHLQVHNHSPAFYRLLGRCMPDWQRRKLRLEQHVV